MQIAELTVTDAAIDRVGVPLERSTAEVADATIAERLLDAEGDLLDERRLACALLAHVAA